MKKMLLLIGVALLVLGSAVGKAHATASAVIFLHGTGTHTDAKNNYWGKECSSRNFWGSCTGYSYFVDNVAAGVPYRVLNVNETDKYVNEQAWDQANRIVEAKNSMGVQNNIVLFTHSNGCNGIRYAAAHPTWGTAYGTYSQALAGIKWVDAIACDYRGTPLADWINGSSFEAGFWNTMMGLFGMSYTTITVQEQFVGRSDTNNSNGTTALYPSPVFYNFVGTGSGGSCNGWIESLALDYLYNKMSGWGWGASDGFIPTASATAGGYSWWSGNSNHNSNRANCDGVVGSGGYGGAWGEVHNY